MNKTLLLLPMLITLNGCLDDNEFDVFRSSSGIDSQNINVFVEAQVHTHLGDTPEEDETHTTIQVEFYGYDRDGYTFGIALGEDDQLSIAVDGEERPIPGESSSTSADENFVKYLADFDQTVMGTEFSINIDRASEASLITLPVILLDESPFNATPTTDTSVSMDESIVLEWVENDAYNYRLKLRMRCIESDGNTISGSRYLPGHSMTQLSSPLTFTPSDYFTLPTEAEFTQCDLHSILHSSVNQDITDNIGLASAKTRIARQQSIVFSISLD